MTEVSSKAKEGESLLSLRVQTTTGYSYAVPVTPFGQFLAIVYGLLGIPIMVLAAVDIGRFLSHIVLELYAKVGLLFIYLVMKSPLFTSSVPRDAVITELPSKDHHEDSDGAQSEETMVKKPLVLFCCRI